MRLNFGQLRSAVSTWLSRAGLASRAGLTYGGDRDVYQTLGYKKILTTEDYRSRYDREGIAARVVDAKPQATWRGSAQVIEDVNPEVETLFEEEWNDLADRLKVWSVFQRADILAGLGRYSVILIGAPGDTAAPLPSSFRAEEVLYLQPYAEDEAKIMELDLDPRSERFGQPSFYSINRRSESLAALGINTQQAVPLKVHYSRVIHVADNTLDDQVLGKPRMERVWNDLDDLLKVKGGGSEAFWQRANQGMVIDIDNELPLTDLGETRADQQEALTTLRETAEALQHGQRKTMVTRGADITMLGSDVADFGKPVDSVLTVISGATGIPKRILIGSERGELASTQDRENWNDLISDRRRDFAGPYIVRPFVDRLIKHGALTEPEQYEIMWAEVNHLTSTERATVAVQWAGLNSAAGELVVTGPEIRERVLDLPPLKDSQIQDYEDKQAEKLAQQQEIMKGQAEEEDEGIDPESEEEAPQPKAAASRTKVPKAQPRGKRGGQRHWPTLVAGGSRE